MSAQRVLVILSVVLAVVVVVLWGLRSWVIYDAAVFRYYDRTTSISLIAGRDLVANGAVLLVDDHGMAKVAFVERHPPLDPTNVEYQSGSGGEYPAVGDARAPTMKFRIMRLRERRSEWSGSHYWVDLLIKSGEHGGESFEVRAYDIMALEESGQWTLRPFIQVCDSPTGVSPPRGDD